MAQIIHNISNPNDGLGDKLRAGFDHQNQMNTELYNDKVDKVLGKDLSSNDFTSLEKSKLAGIEAGAQVNVPADWNTLLNKPAQLNNSVGYFYYDNTLGGQAFSTAATVVLNNNNLGSETDITHPPYGVTNVWDTATNAFNFSQLSIGDTVDLRVDYSVVSASGYNLFLQVGIGTPSIKTYILDKNAVSFSIANQDVKVSPAKLFIVGDASGTILVDGFFTRIIRSGVNVIDVVVESDAPNDGKLYGRKNKAWNEVPINTITTLGLIKIVDKAGDFFTNLATASAYIRTFTSATITNESFSNGTFWFTVPNGSSFANSTSFLGHESVAKSAYIEDTLGLIATFSGFAFCYNRGNNILGNVTLSGGSCFSNASGFNSFGNVVVNNANNFGSMYGRVTMNNLTCNSHGVFIYNNAIVVIYGNYLYNAADAFHGTGKNSAGRFEIYGTIGTTVGNDYANFFPSSTAVIWAPKIRQTINAGGIEGDLARAQTNGAKLFFGYADAQPTGTINVDEFIYTTGAQVFTTYGTVNKLISVFLNGQKLVEGTQWSRSGNNVTVLVTLVATDEISIQYITNVIGLTSSSILSSQTEWKNTNIGTQTITNGSTVNLLSLVTEANKVTANTDSFDALSIVSNGIKTVWRGARITHLIRLTFNIATGNAQFYRLDLKRSADNSVVASFVVNRNQAYTTQTIELMTRTLSSSDPFVSGGFYLSFTNDSGVTATLNGEMQLVIISNYQFPQ